MLWLLLKILTTLSCGNLFFSQVFLKGRAKRHADATDGRGKKAKPVADFHMEGNRTVTYGKIEHVVGYLLMQLPMPCGCHCHKTLASKPAGFLTQAQSAEPNCTLKLCLPLQEDGYRKPVAELNKIQQNIRRGAPIPSHIDAYSLHTLPGVDSVFMLAVTVALDESLFSPQQMMHYGPYGRYGYGGGYGYGGYGGYGYGGRGFGYGAPLLLGAGLLAPLVLFGGGFW